MQYTLMFHIAFTFSGMYFKYMKMWMEYKCCWIELILVSRKMRPKFKLDSVSQCRPHVVILFWNAINATALNAVPSYHKMKNYGKSRRKFQILCLLPCTKKVTIFRFASVIFVYSSHMQCKRNETMTLSSVMTLTSVRKKCNRPYNIW